MPRKTPVREIQKEEVAASPLRRSSRLNTSSPVPTKVLTRRNSSSDIASSSTPKVTRTRRSSVNQEPEPVEDTDKKKTSTIRTRRSSITKTSEPVQEESTPKPGKRASSVTKEQPAEAKTPRRRKSVSKETDAEEVKQPPVKELVVELKKTIKRRNSVTEDIADDEPKISTRSRSHSATKKVEESKVLVIKDVPGSTPFKISPSADFIESLNSIEETNQETISPEESPKKIKRKVAEISKIDFDLSVINEASLTEEEPSPNKKSKATEDEVQSEKSKNTSLTNKILKEEEPKLGTSNTTPKFDDIGPSNVSSSSFSLNLSYGGAENGVDDKENVSPKKSSNESECEPMEVDISMTELPSPIMKRLTQSPKVLLGKRVDVSDHEKIVAAEITGEMDKILSEEITIISPKKPLKTQREIVVAVEKETKVNLKDLTTEISGSGVGTERPLTNETNYDENLKSGKPAPEAAENGAPEINIEKKVDRYEKNTPVSIDLKELPEDEVVEGEIEEQMMAENGEDEPETTSPLDELEPTKTKPDVVSPITTPAKHDSPLQEETSSKAAATLKTVPVVEDENVTIANETSAKILEESIIIVNDSPAQILEESVMIVHETSPKTFEESVIFVNETSVNPKVTSTELVNQEKNVQDNTNNESVIIVAESASKTTPLKETVATAKKNSATVVTDNPAIDRKRLEEENCNLENKNNTVDEENSITEKTDSRDKSASSIFATPGKNENEDKLAEEKQMITKGSENGDDKVDSSPDNEDGYESPVTNSISLIYSLSDEDVDEIVRNEERVNPKSNNLYERSLELESTVGQLEADSKQTPQKEAGTVVNEQAELQISLNKSVNQEREETSENEAGTGDNEVVTEAVESQIKTADENLTSKLADDNNLETTICEEKVAISEQDSTVTNSLKKRSSDRTSMTLQETMKLGETPEEGLSGRIHKYVDLFCAGIKNKADVSINVSLEYVGQSSEIEDESKTNILEVSLTASDINREAEFQKGSKRRRICYSSANELETSELECSVADSDEADSSINVSKEEEVCSTEKTETRKSNADGTQSEEDGLVKTGSKVSFLENKRSSTGSPKRDKAKQTPVVAIPLTPFKPANVKIDSEEIEDVSGAEEEDGSSDEENVESVYNKLFSTSLEENDSTDPTWIMSESETDSTDQQDEEDGKDTMIDEESVKIDKEKTSSDDSEDEVFLKSEENKGSQKKQKTRKLLRLSTYNVHISSPDESIELKEKIVTPKNTKSGKATPKPLKANKSDENVEIESKSKTQKQEVIQPSEKQTNASNRKKKLRNSFESETVEVMMPETSEVASKRGKKRRLHNSIVTDENMEKGNTSGVVTKKKKLDQLTSQELKKRKYFGMKLGRGVLKNVRKQNFKPSSGTTDGWIVTSIENL